MVETWRSQQRQQPISRHAEVYGIGWGNWYEGSCEEDHSAVYVTGYGALWEDVTWWGGGRDCGGTYGITIQTFSADSVISFLPFPTVCMILIIFGVVVGQERRTDPRMGG